VDPLGKTKAELFALTKALFYGIKSNPLPVMTPGSKLVSYPGCASCHPNGEGSEAGTALASIATVPRKR